jgi:hypothetical protein
MLRELIYFAGLDLAAANFAACRWTRCIRGIENEVADRAGAEGQARLINTV